VKIPKVLLLVILVVGIIELTPASNNPIGHLFVLLVSLGIGLGVAWITESKLYGMPEHPKYVPWVILVVDLMFIGAYFIHTSIIPNQSSFLGSNAVTARVKLPRHKAMGLLH
jgi:hypothetical protein